MCVYVFSYTVWYEVCQQFKDNITGLHNFSAAWVDGTSSRKTNNLVAYGLLCPSLDQSTKIPVAKSLISVQLMLRNVCYLLFIKYSAIHELEERHGANLGQVHKIQKYMQRFAHYIAESQKTMYPQLFFGLMNRSADKGKSRQ